MLPQETSGHYVSVFVMLMIVLLEEVLLRCVAKYHSGYGKIKLCVRACMCAIKFNLTYSDMTETPDCVNLLIPSLH